MKTTKEMKQKPGPSLPAEIEENETDSVISPNKELQLNELDQRLQKLLEITDSYYQKIKNDTSVYDPVSNENKENNDMIKNAAMIDRPTKLKNSVSKQEQLDSFDKNPSYIKNGEMRDYQLRGLNWLICLHKNNIDGILADEMGLGKTLQTISFLGFLKHHRNNNLPHLVIAPKSTMNSWMNEFSRWCPSLNVVCLIGDAPHRDEFFKKLRKFDVLLTTYNIVIIEKTKLKKIEWNYLVIDEAQRIKNQHSLLSTLLRKFSSKNRLLLTGTPFQNNLPELWALLNFLMPDLFNSEDDFNSWFDTETCLNNVISVRNLQNTMRPFILRRLKSDVEKTLKPKKEFKILIGLTTMQRKCYEKVLLKELRKEDIFGNVIYRPMGHVMMPLRKCVAHPYLLKGIEPYPYLTDEVLVQNCSKLIVLDKLLKKLEEDKSKVLIFCVFIGMLDILEDYCNLREYQYCRMDGNTQQEMRNELIESFNAKNSNIFIFMSTTRCGGLGINLQSANSVIIYSSDWNPHVDLQAMDRVHRIGQKKDVNVYRLITKNTIEERIEQLSSTKMHLDKMINHQEAAEFAIKNFLSIENIENFNDDINDILAKSEKNTVKTEDKYNLTFDYFGSLYIFEGEDYRIKKKKRELELKNVLPAKRKKKQYI